jgi:hypothetical protein
VLFFWAFIIGGLLTLLTWVFDPAEIVTGAAGFLLVVGFVGSFVAAFREARRERVSVLRAIGRSARRALRLALELAP